MNEISFKPRDIHILPGRVRFELFGLKHNAQIAEKFEAIFSTIDGIIKVHANSATGKVLLFYDAEKISLEILSLFIRKFEEVLFKKKYTAEEQEGIQEHTEATSAIYEEVAAVAESPSMEGTSYFEAIPYERNTTASEERVPLPLALSVTGLGVLGIKQLFWGRSALARHPLPFYLSGAIAITTGYPFLKKGLQKFEQRRKLNLDLLLGASSLALALIRENLIVLAGISILQYLNWKRKQELKTDTDILDQDYVSPEIESYGRRMSRFGIAAAGVSLAVTRNPLSALGVLLAANPRPVLTSTEYTWKQADYVARKAQKCLPENGSMYQLSQTKAVIFDDASLIVHNGNIREETDAYFRELRPGTMVAVLKNRKNVDLYGLASYLYDKYQLNFTEINETFPKQRHEVLFVTEKIINTSENIVSFYPSIEISKLPELAKSCHQARQLDKLVKRNARLTSIWNVIGTIIAAPLYVSAPLINLFADGLTLSLLSKAKRWTERNLGVEKKELKHEGHGNVEVLPWHAMDAEELVTYLQTNKKHGLTDEQIEAALRTYGYNQLQSKKRPHWIKSYLAQFKEFTTIILGTTALLSMVSGHLFDGLAMTVILMLNAGIGTIQERKAERAVETMAQFVPPNCVVIRNGERKEIPADELVPGDIVELEAGDRVPADIRLIQAMNVEVNESSLSGESLPVRKNVETVGKDEALSDRTNMLYMGTHLTRGKAIGVVVQTGRHTEMGHLVSLLSEEEDQETPLQKQVTSISKTFMKGALVAGAVVFVAGLLRGNSISQMITTSLALTASAIPEGLPMTITIALTAGIFRMAKNKSLVRKLSALETLGRATIICSDKTGTLTKNEMTVKKISTVNAEFNVTGDGYNPEGKILDENGMEQESKELEKLLRIGLLCSNTTLQQENGRWGIKGDPTEGAIVTLAAKRNILIDNHNRWKRLHEVPFDSYSGMMTVVCKNEDNHKDCYVMSKGSVEKILNYCTHYQKNGRKYPLTKDIKEKILQKNEEYAKQSLRVLGFAYRPIEHKEGETCFDNLHEQLIYVGMVGMIDPPKPEVEKSIREALELGIKPIMITGDHPITALAIAKQIGICDGSKKVITGTELEQMSDEELEVIIDDVCIFARVTPEHKLRIVMTLQKQGHIVAMTGDGVNDSPAIKRADVGIAMGQTGTQVTKETADMVLKEDHFGSIVDGVKEGRTIIGNIRKALGCLLSGNLAEIIITSIAVIAGMPLPIVPIQILLMNLLTDALPAMVLAVNPGNKTKQTKRQEIADASLYKQVVTRGVLLGAGSLGLFALSLAGGASLATARTIAFATLVAGQLVQTFSWRQADSKENIRDWSKDRFLVSALGVSWLSLLATIYIGPLNGVFGTVALPIAAWAPILAVAGSSAVLAKPIARMFERTQPAVAPPRLSVA